MRILTKRNVLSVLVILPLSTICILSAWPRQSVQWNLHKKEEIQKIRHDSTARASVSILSTWPKQSVQRNNHRREEIQPRGSIAILVPSHSTSRWSNLDHTALKTRLIPSLIRTITPEERNKFQFRLYLAFDHDDAFWMRHTPDNATLSNALQLPSWIDLHAEFYTVPEHRIPFNEVANDAYRHGVDFFCRVNDDTVFTTSGWVTLAIRALESFDPPLIGVVGPTFKEGNIDILTHDFVSRKHIDIFGVYYSTEFDNWWTDDWITNVYEPGRSVKLNDWHVKHDTAMHGTRYTVDFSQHKLLSAELTKGRERIRKFIKTQIGEKCVAPSNPKFYSQSNEDKAMYEQFYKSPLKCGGVFVEIGALDGRKYSNSLFFETSLDWKCLLVEANPENAKHLKINRPNAWTVHAAMCSEKEVQFRGSDAVGGVVSSMTQKHIDGWIKASDKVVSVPCMQWKHLFSMHNITHVDVFVIDVEGGEVDVLSVMDWSVNVDFFIIEMSRDRNDQKSKNIIQLLDAQGYAPVSWDLKSWCVPNHDCTTNTVFERVKKVVSFSLYGGESRRYTDGALANAHLMPEIYPGWTMRVYYDNTVPEFIIRMLDMYTYVEVINMEGSYLNQMTWRFLVASDATVERYVVRDIDSRLSHRERVAVDEWIASGQKFHVMRDHPSHSAYAMSGGLWGGTRNAFPDMKNALDRRRIKNDYVEDMNFLSRVVWPVARRSVMQHDSFGCHSDRWGETRPFPTSREGAEHVGSVWINNKMRQEDVDLLQHALARECDTPAIKAGRGLLSPRNCCVSNNKSIELFDFFKQIKFTSERTALEIANSWGLTETPINVCGKITDVQWIPHRRASAPSKIPNYIFQTWKSTHLSYEICRGAISWTQTNPEYDYFLFDDKKVRLFILTYYGENVLNAYDCIQVGAAKADVWRLLVIYVYGGIYFDMDSSADGRFPFRTWISATDEVVVGLGGDGMPHQWGLIYKRRHPIIARAIQIVFDNIRRKPNRVYSIAYDAYHKSYFEHRNLVDLLRVYPYNRFSGQVIFQNKAAKKEMLNSEIHWQKQTKIWKDECKMPAPQRTASFKVIILTQRRHWSLRRLLDSIAAASYDGHAVHLEIRVDLHTSMDYQKTIRLANSFKFAYGTKTVHIDNTTQGLKRAWFNAWTPTSDSERAVILEDDMELSPLWFSWLRRAWKTYGNRDDLGGISLQRQRLRASDGASIMKQHDAPFLYRVVGSFGFSPNARYWKHFVEWTRTPEFLHTDIATVPGTVTSSWAKLEKNAWTLHWIWWCWTNRQLYTMYVHSPNGALIAHWAEPGVHSNTRGRPNDSLLQQSEPVLEIFPQKLDHFGWDFQTEERCYETYLRTMSKETQDVLVMGKTIMMDEPSVRLLCKYLKPNFDVLEWGSGGSTAFYSQFVKSWNSIEHDPIWAAKVQKYVDAQLKNVVLHSVPVTSWSSDTVYGNDGTIKDFSKYIELPRKWDKKFDLILIDGRARADCALSVLRNNLLSTNGVVVIHDWERLPYKQLLNKYDLVEEDTSRTRHLGVLTPKQEILQVAKAAVVIQSPPQWVKSTESPKLWIDGEPEWATIYNPDIDIDTSANRTFPQVPTVILNRIKVHQSKLTGYVRFVNAMSNFDTAQIDSVLITGGHTPQLGRVAEFKNVWINSDGWIVSRTSDRFVRNAGCASTADWRSPKSPGIYEMVITIAEMWGSATWHFPMEAFVGLFTLESHSRWKGWLHNPAVYVHVSSKNQWTLNWLTTLNIPTDRVISGEIVAQHVLVPEMGRCGTPSLAQIFKMKRFMRQISAGNDAGADVVIIQRHGEREIRNHAELESTIREWATARDFSVAVHSPTFRDSLRGQMGTFGRAKYIFAPHGAGLLFQIASPPNAIVVEFMQQPGANLCFLRLAYVLGHQYIMKELVNGKVNVGSALATVDSLKGARNIQNSPTTNTESKKIAAVVVQAPPRNKGIAPHTLGSWGPRFCLFLHMLRSVDIHLNHALKTSYPVYVIVSSDPELDPLGDDARWTAEDKALIRSWAPHTSVEFVEVPMYSGNALPQNTDQGQIDRWILGKDGGIPGRPLGYRAMCRLWSGRLQRMSFLDNFEFYMRLDDDSFFTSPLREDPFKILNSKDYAFIRRSGDGWGVKQLKEVTERHGKWSGNTNSPYTNFHIARVSLFRTPEFTSFWEDLERNRIFMKSRVGDALLHSAILEMFVQKRFVQLKSIPYAHNSNDYAGYPPKEWDAECPTRAKTASGAAPVIWSNDMHISPIASVKSLLWEGVTFIDKSLSLHCHLTKTCATNLRVLTPQNALTPTALMKDRFVQFYKNDAEFKTVDIVMCFHPSAMCQLFMPLGKRMFVIATTRYEMGRHSASQWAAWNRDLKTIASDSRNLVGANNLYDAEYIKYFTGISVPVLPSFQPTDIFYSPTSMDILVAEQHTPGGNTVVDQVLHISPRFVKLRDKYPHYTPEQLCSNFAILHIPYQVSIMSLFEQYAMGIPLFVPSPEFLWNLHDQYNIVTERTWDNVMHNRRPSKSILQGVNSTVPDPNNDLSKSAFLYWIKFADFYQWPHLIQFNSWADLQTKTAFFRPQQAVSEQMKLYAETHSKITRDAYRRAIG